MVFIHQRRILRDVKVIMFFFCVFAVFYPYPNNIIELLRAY